MVDNPTISDIHDSIRNYEQIMNRDGFVFYYSPVYQELSLETMVTVEFRICIGNNRYYIADGSECTKQECFEYIKSAWPDHFEWILFHPEWF